MAIWSFIRRIFGSKQEHVAPTEIVVERTIEPRSVERYQGTSHRPIDGETLLMQFRDQLTTQAQSHQQLNTLLGTLTTTLNALPQLARQQGQVLETLIEGAARARHRDQAIERNLVQLSEGSDRQTQVLGLVQQQLDLNHEVSLRVAESLRETASAISTFALTSDRHSRALENLAQATQRRVTQADRLEKALQFWLAVVAAICTLALLYAIWAATRGPVVIAIPAPEPTIVAPIPSVIPVSPTPPSQPATPPLPTVVPAPVPAPAVSPPTAVAPATVPPATP